MPRQTSSVIADAITLRPYIALGVEFNKVDGSNTYADCPFCGGSNKLAINMETGVGRCFTCTINDENKDGAINAISFMRQFHKLCVDQTNDWSELMEVKKLLIEDHLAEWKVARSVLNNQWLIPGYSPDGKLHNLYRRIEIVNDKGEHKITQLPLPGIWPEKKAHGIMGLELVGSCQTIAICEGFADGLALSESLTFSTQKELDEVGTAEKIAVVAVPGAGIFPDGWYKVFSDKNVYLMYDNDKSGWDGARRAAIKMLSSPKPPAQVKVLMWGPNGIDPSLPPGYDVRDFLTKTDVGTSQLKQLRRVEQVRQLLEKVKPIPNDWTTSAVEVRNAGGGNARLELTPCSSWQKLIDAWSKPHYETGGVAMKWTVGLDRALSVMLASVLSTRLLGSPLWIKVIGPPSSGKTTLAEAISTSDRYVYACSHFTGIHSGWKGKDGNEDHSMIPCIINKTFIIKDGDTLMRAQNRDKTLAELRDLYDNVTRVKYRHGLERDYGDVRTTVILCGTDSLRGLDSSELGERFLDVIILEGIDQELEREIGRIVAMRAFRSTTQLAQADGTPDSVVEPELATARAMTGGYVNHLREHCEDIMSKVTVDENAAEKVNNYGTFVAFMRSRPSKTQDENVSRELSSRLIEQMARLSTCLAGVLNKNTLDEDILSRVRQVAMDTARGRTLTIVRHLCKAGSVGLTQASLAQKCGQDEKAKHKMLLFLRKIGVVGQRRPPHSQYDHWFLTLRMKQLCKDMGMEVLT